MVNTCKQCGEQTSNRVFCDDECKLRWVYQKYSVEQLGTYEMGRMLGYDPKSVYEWLKNYGIPTRPRGCNWKDNFGEDHSGANNSFYGRKHTSESIAKMSESSKGPSPWLYGEVNHWYGKKGPETGIGRVV